VKTIEKDKLYVVRKAGLINLKIKSPLNAKAHNPHTLFIRTISFSKIARIFSIHTFSIFAIIVSIPGVPDRSGLFPALLQYSNAHELAN
jgi:hypothetical protein